MCRASKLFLLILLIFSCCLTITKDLNANQAPSQTLVKENTILAVQEDRDGNIGVVIGTILYDLQDPMRTHERKAFGGQLTGWRDFKGKQLLLKVLQKWTMPFIVDWLEATYEDMVEDDPEFFKKFLYDSYGEVNELIIVVFGKDMEPVAHLKVALPNDKGLLPFESAYPEEDGVPRGAQFKDSPTKEIQKIVIGKSHLRSIVKYTRRFVSRFPGSTRKLVNCVFDKVENCLPPEDERSPKDVMKRVEFRNLITAPVRKDKTKKDRKEPSYGALVYALLDQFGVQEVYLDPKRANSKDYELYGHVRKSKFIERLWRRFGLSVQKVKSGIDIEDKTVIMRGRLDKFLEKVMSNSIYQDFERLRNPTEWKTLIPNYAALQNAHRFLDKLFPDLNTVIDKIEEAYGFEDAQEIRKELELYPKMLQLRKIDLSHPGIEPPTTGFPNQSLMCLDKTKEGEVYIEFYMRFQTNGKYYVYGHASDYPDLYLSQKATEAKTNDISVKNSGMESSANSTDKISNGSKTPAIEKTKRRIKHRYNITGEIEVQKISRAGSWIVDNSERDEFGKEVGRRTVAFRLFPKRGKFTFFPQNREGAFVMGELVINPYTNKGMVLIWTRGDDYPVFHQCFFKPDLLPLLKDWGNRSISKY